MTRQEVLERLCLLCRGVAESKFASMEASDCFCGKNEFSGVFDAYRFGEPVLIFIEEAVQKAMAEHATQH